VTLEIAGLRLRLEEFELAVDVRLAARVTGIFGPSGAGKTSLLESIAGLRRPQAGRIALGGDVLLDSRARVDLPARARRCGYVPQDLALFPHLDVRRNLLYGAPRDERARPALAHVVEVLELAGLLARGIAGLSGGERQRVAIGRALLAAPRLLLLDEPVSSLDAERKSRILPYLARVRDEFSLPMLYVSHQAAEIEALCAEVLVLDGGGVVAQGPPAVAGFPPPA
jgi:molybdate transport system ATP-binding protein